MGVSYSHYETTTRQTPSVVPPTNDNFFFSFCNRNTPTGPVGTVSVFSDESVKNRVEESLKNEGMNCESVSGKLFISTIHKNNQ